MTQLDHVLRPLKISGIEIKNRVVRTPHSTNLCDNGFVTDAFIAYHEERAKGGVGLTILEGSAVHPSALFERNGLRSYLDNREGYRKLVDRASAHGMRVFQQLWHGGFNGHHIDGAAPWSASNLAGRTGLVAEAMSADQISEIIDAFAKAARFSIEGGIEGIEVNACHGFLIGQFLAATTNHRADGWGGDVEGRSRLGLEILRRVRAESPAGVPVGVRVGPELAEGGINAPEIIDFLTRLRAENLIDYVSFSLGSYAALTKIVGAMHEDAGYQNAYNRDILRALDLPRLVTGRYRTLEEAEKTLAEGTADLIGMTRAHIAEPAIVAKTLERGAHAPRPCIACNELCVGGLLTTGVVRCTVNPSMGNETHFTDSNVPRAENPKSILVIGGGPAGLEAARILAMRGHGVTLAEAGPSLGGRAATSGAQVPYLGSLKDLADWYAAELDWLGVTVQLDSRINVGSDYLLGFDHVVLATGGVAQTNGVQGNFFGQPLGIGASLSDPVELLNADVVPESVLIADDVQHYEALALAEALASRGSSVTLVTRFPAFGMKIEATQRVAPALGRMARLGCRLLTRTIAFEQNNQLKLQSIATGGTETVVVEKRVVVAPRRPDFELVEHLRTAGISHSVIGEAKGASFVAGAIHDGAEMALRI